MVEHALPGSTHMGLLANNIKWMGGFPLYPPKIEKNWKPESHAEEAHCSVHVILFTALSATPSTFNSLSNILFISPLPVAPQPRARCQPRARIYGHIGDGFDPKWLIFTSVKESADGWHPKISQGRWAAGIFWRIYAINVWNAYLINRDDQRNPRVSLEGPKNYLM